VHADRVVEATQCARIAGGASPRRFLINSGSWSLERPLPPVDQERGGGCFDRSLPVDAAKLDILEQLVVLADEIGCTLAELALAFVVATPR
jgi:aryl-alcohol dehydrogenase-like predicted oxidoreductase